MHRKSILKEKRYRNPPFACVQKEKFPGGGGGALKNCCLDVTVHHLLIYPPVIPDLLWVLCLPSVSNSDLFACMLHRDCQMCKLTLESTLTAHSKLPSSADMEPLCRSLKSDELSIAHLAPHKLNLIFSR